ncbi:MAG TPA: glycosyltransferase [Vicinamibacterales bacterium]|nr:glycosyltransferase [Vicinamibacterales bacterium]
MRILLVVHGFPPAASGGTEIYADAHARTLRDRFGDDIFVLTREQDPSRPDYATRIDTRQGIRIAWINNCFRRTRRFEETYANPAIDDIASRLIDEFAPDVAHVHHLTCLSTGIVHALADRRVAVFMTLHDYWLLCHRGQLLDEAYRLCPGPEPDGCKHCLGAAAGVGAAGFAGAAVLRAVGSRLPPMISRSLLSGARRASARFASTRRNEEEARRRLAHMRELCGRVTLFFAPSDHLRRRFVEFGVAPARIQLSPYGIERVRPSEMAGSSADRLRVGFVGSLIVSKAPHLLIEAFQRLPEKAAALDIFGGYAAYHGDDRYWRRLAPWMGDRRVRFHGAVPHDRISDVMSAIDVLVVPSVWPETSPIVIREALDAGVPVIGSRIGGIPETVQDGVNGLLCRPGDVDDLHRALSRLVTEPELLQTLRHGIAPVRTIDEDVMVTRGFYDSAGETRESRPSRGAHVNPPSAVAAIVLSYGAADDAILAARSLQGSRPAVRVIIVENGSSEESRAALAAVGEEVTVIQTGRNLGFSGGMNVGIRNALAGGASHVLLVNSDMILPPDCVDRLRAALEATGAGIAGPVVLSRAMPDRVGTLGISYRPTSGRMRHQSFDVSFPSMDAPRTRPVDAVSGCAMLVRRAVIDAIGLLDEQYFFSFEDLDWCFRARRAGFETVLAGDAIAYHEGARSIGVSSPRRLYYAARNHLRFAERAGNAGRLASLWRGSSIVVLNVAHAVRAGGGSLPTRLAAVARGTRDHFAGRYGQADEDATSVR